MPELAASGGRASWPDHERAGGKSALAIALLLRRARAWLRMMPGADDLPDRLRAQAQALRLGDGLGRSHALDQLFGFLLACSIEGRSPKELEIAEQVFGRTANSADQDATVRVHIHRLRRKLDECYAGPGIASPERLAMPKGSYRLAIEPMPARSAPGPVDPPALPGLSPAPPAAIALRRWALAAAAGLVVLTVAGYGGWRIGRRPVAALDDTRASALWRPDFLNGRRIVVVVGDYYIFGQRDPQGDVSQLVRRFDINSSRDLARLIAQHPERADDYVDLGLNYLPVGIASALRAVVPVVRGDDAVAINNLVVPVSQLAPEMLKQSNLVYLGYISALGDLRDPMFSGSRFAIGQSYDEIIDRRSGRTYMAGTHLEQNERNPSQDYALIAAFPGVAGNWTIVIAGTRDAALMQAADFATRPDGLAAMTRAMAPGKAFEALLSVESLRNVGLRARLVVMSPRGDADWSGRQPQRYPDEFIDTPDGAHAP